MSATDLWRTAVERTRRVPSGLKTFDQSGPDAARVHGIDEDCLTRLLDLGLHHRGVAAGRRFDDRDLTNVALTLDLPTPMRRTMKWWSQSLRHRATGPSVRRTVHLTAMCPAPGHAGDCRYELNPSLVRCTLPGSLAERRSGAYSFDIEARNSERFLDERHHGFVTRMSALEFHFIPPELTGDIGFAADTGLADCRLGARFGRHLATSLGLAARQRYGYFLAGSYLLWHNWIEFQEQDDWFPVDPFWLANLARWGVPGIENWPPARSPQPLLWQPSDQQDGGADDFFVVKHNGEPMRPAMMSSVTGA